MATEVKLPRLGQGMESGTIVKWLKSEGDDVEKGEPLYELDTDKVTQEVEADASGVLLKIAIAEGEVEVGKTIGVIGEQGEEVDTSVSEDEQEEGSSAPARDTGARAWPRGVRRRQRAGDRDPAACTFGKRPGQGLAAGAPDCARARHRPPLCRRHRPGGPRRRRGRRTHEQRQPLHARRHRSPRLRRRKASRSSSCRRCARRSRAG